MEIVVISSFPPSGTTHHKKLVGVASYAKNTLVALKKNAPDLGITVLAEQLNYSSSEAESRIEKFSTSSNNMHDDDGIVVKRVWKRGSILSYLNLLQASAAHKNAKTVLIEFELAMFGGPLSLIFFPFFLLCLKLQGKKIILVLHQVVTNIESLHGHIGISDKITLSFLINFCIRAFYSLIGLLADTFIVFDNALKDSLSHFTNSKKIAVIPHGVEVFKNIPTQEDARKKLNIPQDAYVVLYFGYIAWYKGTDLLVASFCHPERSEGSRNQDSSSLKETQNDMMLLIAGGANPNHLDKPFYTSYVENVQNNAAKAGITVTGFVDEKDIPLYFSAADVVVLPYRTYMSASGPLSLAFSFGKPFLVSYALKHTLDSPDIEESLRKHTLSKDDLLFETNVDGMKKIQDLANNPALQKKLAAVSLDMAQKRDFTNIGKQYQELLQ